MFLTAQSLAYEYGIDDRIAKFFVDREPPKDNYYWKDKLLYLRPRPGYIFLPLISDLYFRSGVSLDVLLSEDHLKVLEQIGHYAAQQEYGLIDYAEVQRLCRDFVEPLAVDKNNFEVIEHYFEGKDNPIGSLNVPFKALHRGDVFLYSLCVLHLNREKFIELVRTWFALISTLLLMDDAEDYIADKTSGDENAFVESGSNKEGFAQIENMISNNLDHIRSVSYSMAHALKNKLSDIAGKPGIKDYLNA